MIRKKYTGIAIALAWPQTWCKRPGAWYDNLMLLLGFSKNHYYKAGHAALVLIEKSNGQCHYFDFGRYHSPFGCGRARSAITDTELKMDIKATLSKDGKSLKNLSSILEYLHQKKACHGNGDLYGSYSEIDFQKAYSKALALQEQSPIAYGPFLYGGSNCSRFVQSVLMAGNPPAINRFRLRFLVPLTPTPLSNVYAFTGAVRISAAQTWPFFYPVRKLSQNELKTTKPAPVRVVSIPETAQWLSGEGAGSWFYLEKATGNCIRVVRYDEEGVMECDAIFKVSDNQQFDIETGYKITYNSDCLIVTIHQNGLVIQLKRANNKT